MGAFQPLASARAVQSTAAASQAAGVPSLWGEGTNSRPWTH